MSSQLFNLRIRADLFWLRNYLPKGSYKHLNNRVLANFPEPEPRLVLHNTGTGRRVI